MVFNKRKQGQAAIEFLMTYGWMLLVVLIVGALIFSFVDFGSLLPNQSDLSNNLRGDATQIVANSQTDTITLIATYIGSKASTINANGVVFKSDIATDVCNNTTGAINITNVDTEQSSIDATNINFINGQLLMVQLNCTGVDGYDLISGDSVEGDIGIQLTNARSKLVTTSSGRIRVAID